MIVVGRIDDDQDRKDNSIHTAINLCNISDLHLTMNHFLLEETELKGLLVLLCTMEIESGLNESLPPSGVILIDIADTWSVQESGAMCTYQDG